MNEEVFQKTMFEIVLALKKAGYHPHDQLTGFLLTGNVRYITRLDGAREKAVGLDKARIREYLKAPGRPMEVRQFRAHSEIAESA